MKNALIVVFLLLAPLMLARCVNDASESYRSPSKSTNPATYKYRMDRRK